MRKFLFFFMVASFYACNSTDGNTKVDAASTTDSSANNNSYAYTASYSSDFEMGDSKNSSTVLDLWKIWEDGDLSKASPLFADSIEMHMADGTIMKGSKDSVLSTTQQFRSMFTSMKCSVAAFMSTRSKDKKEDWVCIWGKEISTHKNGNIDSVQLQETWRLNPEGKINLVYQYTRALKPTNP